MSEFVLQTGYARDKITPPMGVHIPGHGFKLRPSTGIIDDVYIYAVAFTYGETKGILFNCDTLGITTAAANEIQQLVSERTGVPAEAVFIACTHCHTSSYLAAPNASDERLNVYYARVYQIFCDLAQFAMEDLKDTTVKIARGEVADAGFVRRYRMKDGTLKTNPPTGSPDIDSVDGVQDTSLQLIRFIREGGKEIVLINFGTHPDVVGGDMYSPDWPGYTVDAMKAALEFEAEVIMLNGFGGDSNHVNRFWPKPPVKGLTRGVGFAKRVARKVAGEALKVYDDAKEIPVGPIAGYKEVASMGKNPHEPWEEPIAQQIVDCKVQTEAELPDDLRAYGISLKKAKRILNCMKLPERLEITMQGLQVGSIAFIGAPGEPFSETGMEIKERSPMAMTCLACRANGSEGYFPTCRAFDGAGYEREYTKFGPDCADSLADAAVRILKKMAAK